MMAGTKKAARAVANADLRAAKAAKRAADKEWETVAKIRESTENSLAAMDQKLKRLDRESLAAQLAIDAANARLSSLMETPRWLSKLRHDAPSAAAQNAL